MLVASSDWWLNRLHQAPSICQSRLTVNVPLGSFGSLGDLNLHQRSMIRIRGLTSSYKAGHLPPSDVSHTPQLALSVPRAQV